MIKSLKYSKIEFATTVLSSSLGSTGKTLSIFNFWHIRFRIDNEDIREFNRRVENMAWDGPVFNRTTLDFINELQIPLYDHVMIWLANEF